MEQLEYNLLFRSFVGLSLDDEIWDETVFTKNRERLIEGDIANKFMAAVLNQEAVKALLSNDHFSVDGTLVEREMIVRQQRLYGFLIENGGHEFVGNVTLDQALAVFGEDRLIPNLVIQRQPERTSGTADCIRAAPSADRSERTE